VSDEFSQHYGAFLRCLGEADEYGATDVALGLIDDGADPERVLLGLVAPAQAQVGRWWQRNEWSVAQEHAASHISERVVAAISAAVRAPGTRPGRVVVGCLDGEWHALPARIVAEVLRLRGWNVTFLGASVPLPHLVSYLHQYDAHAVALSCAIPMRLPVAHRAVEACRRLDVPLIVGGLGFGADGRWAARLGACWAPSAPAAADAMADPGALRRPPPERLDHLADDEYTALVKRRGELIDASLDDLRRRFPPVAAYSTAQLDNTIADLGHIVDALAAAVYVDDPTLFTEFLGWTADVLTCRGIPARSLGLALDRYGAELYDFPRALGTLAAGHTLLATMR
jgi:methanogenic corrinoid protein MtbC1